MKNAPACDLCSNPYPYMCSECQQTLMDETEIQADEKQFVETQGSIKPATKLYIGSGEDLIMEMI